MLASPRIRPPAAPRDLLVGGTRCHQPAGRLAPLLQPTPRQLTEALRRAAEELGLPRLGVTDASPLEADEGRVLNWLDAGRAAEMSYLGDGRTNNYSPRAHPRSLLPEARSIVVVAVGYSPPQESHGPAQPVEAAPVLRGVIAAYARGSDYHHVVKDRLLLLADALADLLGRKVLARACVDTAPLLERALAVRAGLGFVAKNTMLLTPGHGSYFVLGELLVDVELENTHDHVVADGCGRCRACLDACPTQAFPAPNVLDARKCVSYLTIELGGEMPRDLRAGVGPRVFGCDVCQSVCPYNQTAHKKPSDFEFAPQPHLDVVDLERLLFLGSAGYRTLIRGTALRRTHRAQLCRNAAIALGNSGLSEAIEPLRRALEEHPLELCRSHAAWGLGRLGFDFKHDSARDALLAARKHRDQAVREEVRIWCGPV